MEKNAGNQLCISKPPTTENAEIHSSAYPPPPTHDRRKPDAVLQGKRLKVSQLEDWHRQNKRGSVDREQEKADRLIGPERRAHIPAHPHQSNHAIVFIVPGHQHGREKAEDKGEHQSKANPIVLHKDLDTDGALSSQDRWPAWIVDHCTGGPNCPEATKAALTNPDGRQCQATGTFGKFWQIVLSKQAPGREKVRIAAYLLGV